MIKQVNEAALSGKKFEGYLWYSDKAKPRIYHNESLEENWSSQHPFVVEGWLLDEQEQSYFIRCLEGKYYISSFDLKELEASEDEYLLDGRQRFIAHRLDEIRSINFRQLWALSSNAESEFQVLKPAQLIFAGFEK